MMRRDELRSMIVHAFADVRYPGDDHIVADPDHCPECEDVAAAFRGRHWKELTPALIFERKDALPLLRPEAFRYFLPAYLLACVDARRLAYWAKRSAGGPF